jgi:UDP:flavonoid glycosyltransferase YjiC (YdhE family)
MGRDQHDNAARVAFHGAGLRLDRAESPAAIRAAITAVLGDPKFKLAAKALQDEILAQDSEAQLISELEMLEDSNLGRPKSPGLQTGAIAATVLL